MANRLGFDNYLISEKYNTKLDPAMEKQYQAWLTTLPENQRSTKDYDLRGYFLAGMMGDPEIQLYNRGKDQHFIDRYKKPNHPTFSDLSMYHNQDGFVGGHWTDLGNGKRTFEAGPTNTYSKSELAKYMADAEAGNTLIDNRDRFMGYASPEMRALAAGVRPTGRGNIETPEWYADPLTYAGGLAEIGAKAGIRALSNKYFRAHMLDKGKLMNLAKRFKKSKLVPELTVGFTENVLSDYLE